MLSTCSTTISPPQHLQITGHSHSVEPVQEARDGVVVGSDVARELAAEALFEPVNSPQGI